VGVMGLSFVRATVLLKFRYFKESLSLLSSPTEYFKVGEGLNLCFESGVISF
jgi:hypothetical protein